MDSWFTTVGGATGMTKTVRKPDLSSIIGDLATRVRAVEQQSTSKTATANAGSDLVVDTITVGGVLLDNTNDPATNLVLTTGSFYDIVFIDAIWDPPVSGSAIDYDIEVAKKNADDTYQLKSSERSGSNSIRITPLESGVTYGVRVTAINRMNQFSEVLPAEGWVDITTAVDASVPPAVTDVTLARGATSVIIKWTPLTMEQAPDVANGHGLYEVEIHNADTFDALVERKHTPDYITAFNGLTTQQTIYGRVRPVDTVGNAGPWATAIAGITAGGVVDAMVVAGLDAAKITVGFLDVGRLQANSILAEKMASSAFTTQTFDLAGGQFRVLSGGTTGTTRMLINSQGLSLYNSSGTRTGHLDTATGDANFTRGMFTGTVRATAIAAKGQRTSSANNAPAGIHVMALHATEYNMGSGLTINFSEHTISVNRTAFYMAMVYAILEPNAGLSTIGCTIQYGSSGVNPLTYSNPVSGQVLSGCTAGEIHGVMAFCPVRMTAGYKIWATVASNGSFSLGHGSWLALHYFSEA